MKKKIINRILTCSLSIGMCMQLIACGTVPESNTDPGTDTGIIPESVSADTVTEAVSPDEVHKVYVYDFDALVNEEWKESAKLMTEKNGTIAYGFSSDKKSQMDERITDILDNTDLDLLDKNSGLYKTIFIYRQLNDTSWRENEAKAGIKKLLDRVDSVKDYNELIELCSDKYFGDYNLGMHRRVVIDEDYNADLIEPYNIEKAFYFRSDKSEEIRIYLTGLGFSESRADEIIKNSSEMDEMITAAFYSGQSLYPYIYFDEETIKETGVKYPIIEILEKLNGLDEEGYAKCCNGYLEFIDEYYRPENALKIRDHMLLSLAVGLARFDNDEAHDLFRDNKNEDPEVNDVLVNWITSRAADVIAHEYMERYITDADMENAAAFREDIMKGMYSVIGDANWLTTNGREVCKRKIIRNKAYFGENPVSNDLEALTLSDDPLENMIALAKADKEFYDDQLKYAYDEREFFGENMLSRNAMYKKELNAIAVFCGYLDDGYPQGEITYEEELALLGKCIAHELSHALSPNGIYWDFEGYYDEWMNDEEISEYKKMCDSICGFFDGKETEGGYTINGSRVLDETFSDIAAIKCCLYLLKDMEDPDYDAFFRAYARGSACYYNDEGIKDMMENDNHLPARERINFILAQFDEFYDTYDVDPESPYYVPEGERLGTLWWK